MEASERTIELDVAAVVARAVSIDLTTASDSTLDWCDHAGDRLQGWLDSWRAEVRFEMTLSPWPGPGTERPDGDSGRGDGGPAADAADGSADGDRSGGTGGGGGGSDGDRSSAAGGGGGGSDGDRSSAAGGGGGTPGPGPGAGNGPAGDRSGGASGGSTEAMGAGDGSGASSSGADGEPSLPPLGPRPSAPESRQDRERARRRAELLAEVSLFATALRQWRIRTAHVDALASALIDVTAEVRTRVLDKAPELLDAALHHAPDGFARIVRRTVDQACADEGIARAAQLRRRSYVKRGFNRSTGMHYLHMEVDPERGEVMFRKIDAEVEAIFHGGHANGQTHAQVEVDAMVNLIGSTSSIATSGSGNVAPAPAPGSASPGPDDDAGLAQANGASPSVGGGPDAGSAGSRSDDVGDPGSANAASDSDASVTGAGNVGPGSDVARDDVGDPGSANAASDSDASFSGAANVGPGSDVAAAGAGSAEASSSDVRPVRRSSTKRVDAVVLIDIETLLHGTHDRSVCETGSGVPLPPDTVRRLLCLATVKYAFTIRGRVAGMASTSQLATADQRRSLRAMYRTCCFPGCDVGFDRCEIHHTIFRRRHGPTDVPLMVPVCSREHHDFIHDHGWTLAIDDDRTLTWTRPDGVVHAICPFVPLADLDALIAPAAAPAGADVAQVSTDVAPSLPDGTGSGLDRGGGPAPPTHASAALTHPAPFPVRPAVEELRLFDDKEPRSPAA